MYQAKEGGGEGGFLAGLHPQPWADLGCLLHEEEHLVRGGVDPVISQEHRAKDRPSLELGHCLGPACDEGDHLLSHCQTRVCKGSWGAAPQDLVPLPSEERCLQPCQGVEVKKIYILRSSPTLSGSSV